MHSPSATLTMTKVNGQYVHVPSIFHWLPCAFLPLRIPIFWIRCCSRCAIKYIWSINNKCERLRNTEPNRMEWSGMDSGMHPSDDRRPRNAINSRTIGFHLRTSFRFPLIESINSLCAPFCSSPVNFLPHTLVSQINIMHCSLFLRQPVHHLNWKQFRMMFWMRFAFCPSRKVRESEWE